MVDYGEQLASQGLTDEEFDYKLMMFERKLECARSRHSQKGTKRMRPNYDDHWVFNLKLQLQTFEKLRGGHGSQRTNGSQNSTTNSSSGGSATASKRWAYNTTLHPTQSSSMSTMWLEPPSKCVMCARLCPIRVQARVSVCVVWVVRCGLAVLTGAGTEWKSEAAASFTECKLTSCLANSLSKYPALGPNRSSRMAGCRPTMPALAARLSSLSTPAIRSEAVLRACINLGLFVV